MSFINRRRELAALDAWWNQPGPQFGVVWGRRRVGKSFLISHWARDKRVVFHVARNRAVQQELALLSRLAHPFASDSRRDLTRRPFADWDDVIEVLAHAAKDEPLLLVIDEFGELLQSEPNLESALRALWEQVGDTKLRLLITGSAVRVMEALQAERAPLFGRATLRLHLRPFTPGESALMLPGLGAADRARAWGVCGGTPYYLALWDDQATFQQNLERLVCTEQGILLNEGELVLATEDFAGGRRERIPEQVLRAIAAGRTKFSEIKDAIGAEPTRALQALRDLGLIERVQPVRAKPDARRAHYRVADNFLAFWLSIVETHRPAIVRGLGHDVLQVVQEQFDDFMGDRWEEAFRAHLTLIAPKDPRLSPVVDVGQFWRQSVSGAEDPCQLDAVVLTGRSRTVTLVGEAKWGAGANGQRLLTGLRRKAIESGLPIADELVYALCARETVTHVDPAPDIISITAADIFG
ncbi:ATP-binding protein [Acrocarpospora macrocephala]|uniref:ArsR family transcriptional regulator n=1 Tax=Acrocarpospora macrocephala TaxID=150177 RepID=A0A5M3WXF8_9ACTN|nr:ATP-binding protein [Acrocarpospora macrocephala]GES14157.1 ArsR family transcriptional regulator [Acrocarpospora macrocephala]